MIMDYKHRDNDIRQPDAILQTAVNKYFIGIGQEIKKFKITSINNIKNLNLNFPLIQISNGMTALKCPTISGGKWMSKIDFNDLCPEKIGSKMKHQHLHIISNK